MVEPICDGGGPPPPSRNDGKKSSRPTPWAARDHDCRRDLAGSTRARSADHDDQAHRRGQDRGQMAPPDVVAIRPRPGSHYQTLPAASHREHRSSGGVDDSTRGWTSIGAAPWETRAVLKPWAKGSMGNPRARVASHGGSLRKGKYTSRTKGQGKMAESIVHDEAALGRKG
jgi:hypothetical protein